MEAQIGAMNDHHNPFKEIMDDGEDGSAAEELEFDLNQLRETRLYLAPENLDGDGLVDLVATKKSPPLPFDEIVQEYLPQPAQTV